MFKNNHMEDDFFNARPNYGKLTLVTSWDVHDLASIYGNTGCDMNTNDSIK